MIREPRSRRGTSTGCGPAGRRAAGRSGPGRPARRPRRAPPCRRAARPSRPAPSSSGRCSWASRSPVTSGWPGFSSRIRLVGGTSWPIARYILSSVGVMSWASATMQAGEVVSRDDSRTSLTCSASVLAQPGRAARRSPCAAAPARPRPLLLLVGVEVDLALGDRLQRLAVELADPLDPDLVDRVGEQQHLVAPWPGTPPGAASSRCAARDSPVASRCRSWPSFIRVDVVGAGSVGSRRVVGGRERRDVEDGLPVVRRRRADPP